MRELISNIAMALVDHPHNVSVSEIVGKHTSVLELSVDRSDIGQVIGRHGRTAQAMRTILMAASSKLNKRAVLEIIE